MRNLWGATIVLQAAVSGSAQTDSVSQWRPADEPSSDVAPRARASVLEDADSLPNAEATKVANEWLWYLSMGDLERMLHRSSVPFRVGNRIVARTTDDLRIILRDLASATGSARPKAAKMLTAEGFVRLLGCLPPGVRESAREAYGLTKIGEDYFVLIVGETSGGWAVIGLAR